MNVQPLPSDLVHDDYNSKQAVMPAKAGIQYTAAHMIAYDTVSDALGYWIPASAGMTPKVLKRSHQLKLITHWKQ